MHALHSFALRLLRWNHRGHREPEPRNQVEGTLVPRNDAPGILRGKAPFKKREVIIDDSVPYYNRCVDGSVPPQHILDMLSTPSVLIARAMIRMKIAEQDRAVGDSWAEQNNLRIATHMMGDATPWVKERKLST